MKENLPKLRLALYVFVTVATPTLVYLNQQGVVDDFWMGLYSVVAGAVSALAAVNTPAFKDRG